MHRASRKQTVIVRKNFVLEQTRLLFEMSFDISALRTASSEWQMFQKV